MATWSSSELETLQQLEYSFLPKQKSKVMCYVIVTTRTIFWTLSTIAVTSAMLAAISSPVWLIGATRLPGLKGSTKEANASLAYSPSLGIYNRCTKIHHPGQIYTDSCAPFVRDGFFNMSSDEFPNCWKASLVFFGLGILLMVFTVCTSVIGYCKRSIRRKSIFTISGTVQAFAGLMYIFGLLLYPAGWESRRVKFVCGDLASPFNIAECSLGWGFYLALGASLATFFCSGFLSIQAEKSTSSDKVQDEIDKGKSLICLWC